MVVKGLLLVAVYLWIGHRFIASYWRVNPYWAPRFVYTNDHGHARILKAAWPAVLVWEIYMDIKRGRAANSYIYRVLLPSLVFLVLAIVFTW